MSKPETASFPCPECGWKLTTQFGKEDAAQYIAVHIDKHRNPAVLRAIITKSELIKFLKKVARFFFFSYFLIGFLSVCAKLLNLQRFDKQMLTRNNIQDS